MPVTALRTGMRLRDKHMRERIFETEAGDMPDVVFASERSTCRRVEDAARCRIIGTLSIRGIARPLSAEAFVTRNGPGYRAEAEARVLLSDYGIERPRQFGVVAADSIVLRVELTAIPHPAEERAPSGR
jgi:polyisoprenoid-binding protein YceI